jgi:hypothetical protein
MPRPEASRNLGYVLQALAKDLVTERQRVMLLRRENRELRARLAALEESLGQDGEGALTAASRRTSAASPRAPEQP